MELPGGKGLLGLMPGYISSPEWFGIKVTAVFPQNVGTNLGSHQGMVLLFDAESGRPVAVVNGRAITALRTAAASAVATQVLARPDARSLGVLGYGEQAATHVEAMCQVRQLDEILIWGRSFDKAMDFAAQQETARKIPVRAVRSVADAVGCDIVCTTTAAEAPLFSAAAVPSGAHLNVVGSSIPTTAEIDSQTVLASRFFVDYKESALALAGEFRAAKRSGIVGDDHILGSIGDVLLGKVAGRTAQSDITVFKSLGMISEDLIAADHVYGLAQKMGVGSLADF
jgi:ornithine cyclodeaminase